VSKRSVSEFRAAVARELAECESTVDLEPTLRALSEWWSSFVTEAGDAWNKRRWLTEEFIAQWETQRTRLVAAFPLSAVQRRALVARARADQREAVEAAYLAESVRAQVRDQNEALVAAELRDQRDFFDRIEKTPLTDEQARAVICLDNRVQLVAAAGSGKTSTMVAKAGWTIRKDIAKADEMLLLAFNRAAADELGARCSARLENASIQSTGLRATTFRSLGLQVIGEATGEKPRLVDGFVVLDAYGSVAFCSIPVSCGESTAPIGPG